MKQKVVHIITGLNTGGAELMLLRMLRHSECRGQVSTVESVISLTPTSESRIAQEIAALGIRVVTLSITRALDVPSAFFTLIRELKKVRPDIVQTWMYHSDLLGGVAARLCRIQSVIWGIRGGNIKKGKLTRNWILLKICALLSHIVPRYILCCAESANIFHVGVGYCSKKMEIINNGYECSLFTPSTKYRKKMRRELNIGEEVKLIGIFGRYDPLKDHLNFIKAASLVAKKNPDVRFLMAGRGMTDGNSKIMEWIDCYSNPEQFFLVGERQDMPAFFSVIDVFCLSSESEGFPNVVCEAMLMKIPCVVTKAGDSESIVGSSGLVVPISDYVNLAQGLNEMLSLSPDKLNDIGVHARNKIKENYSMDIIFKKYESLYEKCKKNMAT